MDWFKRKNKQYFSYDHDIHSHILPGLDDGVKRVEDSVVIVKKMLELGVKRFSFTPHISFPSPMNTPEMILGKLNELKERLLKEKIEIEADAGAEYKIGEYMIDLIRQGDIASFHGGKVLVEHSFVAPSPAFEEVIFRLQDKGYTPVLAHPERYPFYAKHLTERVWETTGVQDTSELAIVCGFLRERGNGRGEGVVGGKVDRSFFRGYTLGETGGVVGEILEIERIGKVIGLRFTNLYLSGDITSDEECPRFFNL